MNDEIRQAEDRRLIHNAYRRLLRVIRSWTTREDVREIRKAFQFALQAHQGARRRSGEPYILHPTEVAIITAREIGLQDRTAMISALLHDVVEDTTFGLDDIEDVFGKEVASIIRGLTKISNIVRQFGRQSSPSIQVETLRHLFFTLSTDPRIMLVKLADRLHNLRTLDAMPAPIQLRTASETLEFYAPVARRLGLYEFATMLEDLALKYTDPLMYHRIEKHIRHLRRGRQRHLSRFIRPIEEALRREGFRFTIKTRLKSIYSIYRKILTKKVPLEEVYDVLAVRIILDVPPEEEKEACFQVYSTVTRLYRPNPRRFRDWITTPRPNGYQALHTTVMGRDGKWVEVQIRSRRMDEEASRGAAAHWRYKEQSPAGNAALERWIRELNEIFSENSTLSEEIFNEIRYSLYIEFIQVFTPQGELMTLPAGATALDFAFAIHTQLGLQAVGAKVNGQIVPLDHPLQSGDQVQIIRTRRNNVKEEWLSFVKTPQARAAIRRALRRAYQEHVQRGKTRFYEIMEEEGIILIDEQIMGLCRDFDCPTPQEFYQRIVQGVIPESEIRRALRELIQSAEEAPSLPAALPDSVQAPTTPPSKIVIGREIPFPVQFAQCCSPMPGDRVAGIFTSQKVIKIHQTNCPYLLRYSARYGKKLIDVSWGAQYGDGTSTFLASIRLEGIDRTGIVYQLTQVISGFYKVNIRSLQIEAYGGHFQGQFVLEVPNAEVLRKILDELSEIEGVERIQRTNPAAELHLSSSREAKKTSPTHSPLS